MNELLDVIQVKPLRFHQLLIEFENGERKVFDCKPLLHEGVFVALQDETLFNQVTVENGTVYWPGEIDIAPETLYDLSTTKTELELEDEELEKQIEDWHEDYYCTPPDER